MIRPFDMYNEKCYPVSYRYFFDVLESRVPACESFRKCAFRAINDYATYKTDPDYPYVWVPKFSKEFRSFIADLTFLEGFKAGEPVKLIAWQRAFVDQYLCWRMKEDTRRRRFIRTLLFIPRRQGKTMLVSLLCLYELKRKNNEVFRIFCASVDQRNSQHTFDQCNNFVKRLLASKSDYGEHLRPLRESILNDESGGFIKFLPGVKGLDGKGIPMVVLDEVALFQNKDREIINKMKTSQSDCVYRSLVMTTTAQETRVDSPFLEELTHSRSVVAGDVEDDALLAFLFEADKDDEWDAYDTYTKVTPSAEILDPNDFSNEMIEANKSLANRRAYETLRLNRFLGAPNFWLTLHQWKEVANLKPGSLRRIGNLHVGYDLAKKRDLIAVAGIFDYQDGTYGVFFKCWSTKKMYDEAELEVRQKYDAGVLSGSLEIIDQESIDIALPAAYVKELNAKYRLVTLSGDNYNAHGWTELMAKFKMDAVPVTLNYQHEHGRVEFVENMILNKRISAEQDEFIEWQLENVGIELRKSTYKKLGKIGAPAQKMDAFAALVAATDGIVGEQVNVGDTDIVVVHSQNTPARVPIELPSNSRVFVA